MRCGGDDEQGLPTTSQHAHAEDGSADGLGAWQLFAIG